MALFNFPWLRQFIRRRMRPIAEVKAGSWKRRLSVLYALLAWNAFGVVCYAIATGKADWVKYHGLKSEEEANMRPAQHFAKTLGIKKAVVYHVSGTDVNRYEIDNADEKNEQVQEAQL